MFIIHSDRKCDVRDNLHLMKYISLSLVDVRNNLQLMKYISLPLVDVRKFLHNVNIF